MKKILIGGSVVVALGLAWFLIAGSNSSQYTDTIVDDVNALEQELAELEDSVEAGTLSPERAAAGQFAIQKRVESINAAASASQNATLTDQERAAVVAALTRLKQALIQYQNTLVVVDAEANKLPEGKRLRYVSRSGRTGGVTLLTVETIENTDDVIVDIVSDITDDDVLVDVVSDIADAEDMIDRTEEQNAADDMETAEEVSDEDGDTDEQTAADTEDENEDEMTDSGSDEEDEEVSEEEPS